MFRKIVERIKGLLRVLKYKYLLRVSWNPSYDVAAGTYGVEIDSVRMCFYDEDTFFDIESALKEYLEVQPFGDSRVFIDAGAYIGTFAVFAAKLSEKNTIIALEPDPKNFSKLLRNIELNGVGNVVALNECLWNHKTVLSFTDGLGEESHVRFENTQTSQVMLIKATTIDEIYRNTGKKIDYVKMDIEGAELEALDGALQCISECKPKFVISSYHIRDGSETATRVEGILHPHYSSVVTIQRREKQTIAIND